MTNAEKYDAIKDYCNIYDCNKCGIKEECDKCNGDFESSPDLLEAAYDIVSYPNKNAADNVNHPKHYETGKFECIDAMIETQGKEAVKDFCICNAFKYIWRHKQKNGVEDIKKARWYIDKYLELMADGE